MNPLWCRRLTERLASHWRNLKGIQDSPHAVVLGVATRIFFGFTPLLGLKTLLAVGVTRLLRGNLLAAVIAVTLHDVLLPIAPLIAPLMLRWEYDLGYWLVTNPHQLPPHFHLNQQNPSAWLHWSTFFSVGRPLLIGSLVFAAPLSIASYYLTRLWMGRTRHQLVLPL